MSKRTKEQISFNMSKIRSKDSAIEIALRQELWKRNLHYRKNVASVFGKPDVAFIRKRIAVFVDSEFWHGYNWEERKADIKTNQEFWIKKIERNIQRDSEVTAHLQGEGWIVIRFWGNEIKHDVVKCADVVESVFKER